MSTETLVMIPGLGSDRAIWAPTIAAIEGEVHCLVGDTLKDTTLKAMARRILDQAPPRFALAGVSMGGMVAMELMKIAPERVTRLALIDTSARPDTLTRKMARKAANLVVGSTRDFRRLAERGVGSLVHASAPADIRAELTEMSVRVGAKIYIRQNHAVSARGDLRYILPSITVPTAVIVGCHDKLTPVELSEEIHNLTPGSTLHLIPDCGHLPPIEAPQALAAVLLKLLVARRHTGH